MNRHIIIGNLGTDPELRFTANGTAVVNLRIAVNEKFGDKKITTWFPVVLWKGLAEAAAKYLKKGSKIAADGPERERSWEGNDGITRYVREIHAQKVEFLDRAKGTQVGNPGPTEEAPVADAPDDNTEIPF
jgi:single-strand DNA-binding protein